MFSDFATRKIVTEMLKTVKVLPFVLCFRVYWHTDGL